LTVLAPGRRADVALPADVPVAELVPMVLELLGEPGRPSGRPDPWRFSGATGGPLPPGSTLEELGVLDGELLRLGPAAPPPPPPLFDDPVDALAELGGQRDGADARRPAIAAVCAALAAAALLAAVPAGDRYSWGAYSWGAVAVGVLCCTAALVRAARAARVARAAPGPGANDGAVPVAALVAAYCAVPPAAAAGWAALPGPPDASHLLLALVGGGTAAALAQVAVRAVAPVLIGTVTVTVSTGAAVAVGLQFGVAPPALAAVTASVALSAGPLLPRVALRLAGLPRPVVPADAAGLVAADTGPDLLPAAELASRARLARGRLAGLSGGCAVTAAVAAAPAAAPRAWAGIALAAVVVVVLLLRGRAFVDPGPARVHLAAGVATGIALVGLAASAAGAGGRLAGALALLGAAAAGAAATGRTPPTASPVVRRAVDVAEGVLTASAIPLALVAAGVFAVVRAL
jgi:type VII secretion integral membrane protein EccD